MEQSGRKLRMTVHGRFIDHLGIQMYQSPVAAISELVSNAWDADATEVRISLPQAIAGGRFEIRDNGCGMTLGECESRFLNVGVGRRGDKPTGHTAKGRPLLGRKGIGKFAGFGIAQRIVVSTVSRSTGERTVFSMNIDALRGSSFAEQDEGVVDLIEHDPGGGASATLSPGTTITLEGLTLRQVPNSMQFSQSMARRFLLHQTADDFDVLVNGSPLPSGFDGDGVEHRFPNDYSTDERPAGLTIEDGWGVEQVDGKTVRWRVAFHSDPIDEKDLQGVAVFCNGKLAQAPFLFELTGGLGGQFGPSYVSGQVEAAFVDEQDDDLIAPERQRIQWHSATTEPLLQWGQRRMQDLFRIWQARRGAARLRQLEEKVSPFAARLSRLPKHERTTVRKALDRLAGINTLSQKQFCELSDAILTAWEGGRLRDLIDTLAETGPLTPESLIEILAEANILTALHVAEAVKVKLQVIGEVRSLVASREKENPLRDRLAENPWVLGPSLETYRKERSIPTFISDAAQRAGIAKPAYDGRLDLALTSGSSLVVVELMRPGLTVDYDHLSRLEHYVRLIRTQITSQTVGPKPGQCWSTVKGWVVADGIGRDATTLDKIKDLMKDGVIVTDWANLLEQAAGQWREFLTVLADRSPDDQRLQSLLHEDAALAEQ